ncbi:MAG: HAMP domain-containing histidine kinase [Bacteroidaceae bacterium]|nr:HAMP domain-containing histidine kinase [Bacteroidaceae bacterium]
MQADRENGKGNKVNARAFYLRAYEDYVKKGEVEKGVDCGLKATDLYYLGDNLYKEGLDLLNRIDKSIDSKAGQGKKAALHYLTAKERFQIYTKQKKGESALEQLNKMEKYANEANDADLRNDHLYNKSVYFYSTGQNDKANAMLKEMVAKMNEASEQKVAKEIEGLKKQIADNEAEIEDKDSSLTARQITIVGLAILAAILAVALVLGALALMRSIYLTRKQKKTIRSLSENNAQQAKFISNMSSQLEPTLQKLDKDVPEVQALLDFSDHIQLLSKLETSTEAVEKEDVQVGALCEELIEQIRDKVRSGVNLNVDAPKMTAKINKEYVSHILSHLLRNAALYTPEGGHITLEYKKRGAHKHQFIVLNTGETIPEEQHEEVFKPFREVRDLTLGDGLGLPICKRMAMNMNGDLDIDPAFVKGVRFVLHLQDD